MYKLRTLDVWDTLLRRKCHPDLIKLAAARHLLLRWHGQLDDAYPDHWAILGERCKIEGELAAAAEKSGTDDEYTLRQVLARLVERVLAAAPEARPEIVEALIGAELSLEKANTFADPECRQHLANYPAERTLFLSDFYMPATQLSELLAHHGLHDIAEDGVSSCDVGLNKRSGKLFGHVHRQLDISPAEHLHVGDNRHSDVAMPESLGIRAVHYAPAAPHADRILRESLFPDRGNLFNHIERQAVERSEAALTDRQGTARAAFLLGSRCAPLYLGYAIFIAERCLADRLDRVFFLTREGEFFIRVLRAVFPDGKLAGLTLPPAGLLEASRMATFCASLRSVSTTEMMRLWNLYSTQSIFALARSLGVDLARVEGLCTRHGIEFADPVVYPWRDKRVEALFADPDFVALVGAKAAADRELLLDYLDQHGLTDADRRIGIVDIGWRGTIQDNLAILMPDRSVHGYYLGLARFLNEQPANCHKSAFGPNLNQEIEHSHFLDAVTQIEMLSNSPNGSVESYRRDASGTVRANRQIDAVENAVFDTFVSHFQAGVLVAVEQWAEYVDSHAIASAELRTRACDLWDALLSRSPQELSDAYAGLSHNEVFGVGQFVDKRKVPSMAAMLRGVFVRRDRQEVILYVKQTQWGAGLWKRTDLGFLHKCMLASALFAGRLYKMARLRWMHARARQRS